MKKIQLTNSPKIVIVDDEDYQYLNQWKWRLGFYDSIIRGTRKNGIYKLFILPRVIMNTPKGMDTDHIDGNRLDNRKSNLRICTHVENTRNRRPRTKHFKGISWHIRIKKWQARIRKDNKEFHLGYFDSDIEAAKAYNKVAPKYYGEFARLNVIN